MNLVTLITLCFDHLVPSSVRCAQSSGEVMFGCSKDVCNSILVGFLFCYSRFEYIEYTFFLLGKDSTEIALQGVFLFLKIVK